MVIIFGLFHLCKLYVFVCRLYPNPTCKRWRKIKEENEEKLSKMDESEMIALKQKLLKYYGRSSDDDMSWIRVGESLNCRLHHQIDLPPSDIVSEEELRNYINYTSRRVCKHHGIDRETLRLSCGVFLKKLSDNMSNLENRFVIYSAHDNTVQSLLVALADGKDFEFPWPKYAANLIFEVWERNNRKNEDEETFVMEFKDWIRGIDKTRGKYVRVLYDGHVIHLNGNEFTPIEVIQDMWNDLMMDKETYWKRECIC